MSGDGGSVAEDAEISDGERQQLRAREMATRRAVASSGAAIRAQLIEAGVLRPRGTPIRETESATTRPILLMDDAARVAAARRTRWKSIGHVDELFMDVEQFHHRKRDDR